MIRGPYNVPFDGKKGVVCCIDNPLSPKNIVPEPSGWKHIENEFLTKFDLANEFGKAIAPNPNPKSPSGAPPSKKFPD